MEQGTGDGWWKKLLGEGGRKLTHEGVGDTADAHTTESRLALPDIDSDQLTWLKKRTHII